MNTIAHYIKSVADMVQQRGVLVSIRLIFHWIYYEYFFNIEDIADDVQTVREGGEFRIKYKGIQKRIRHVDEVEGRASLGTREILEFSDVSVKRCEGASMIKKDGYIFSPLDSAPFSNQSYVRAASNTNFDSDLTISTGYLIYEMHSAFGHWQTEILTQLRYIDIIKFQTEKIDIILAARKPGDNSIRWKLDWLEEIGIKPDYVLKNTAIGAERLFLPNFIPLNNYIRTYPHPSELRWVSKNLDNSTKCTANNCPRHLFVSRAGQGWRNIINLEQIKPLLQEFNFTVVRPETLSPKQQVNLFSNAKIVCGPAGSGLLRTTYTDDVTLLEIIPNTGLNNAVLVLSNLLNFNYDYVEAEIIPNGRPKSRDQDLKVDTESLRKLFETYL